MPTDESVRLLVVDNDDRLVPLLKALLDPEGYQVQAVQGQGRELLDGAERQARAFRPHIVLMDLRLVDEDAPSDQSGLELLRAGAFSSARCLLYSAYLKEDYRVIQDALKRAGVEGVVQKGDPAALLTAVEAVARLTGPRRTGFNIAWPSGSSAASVIAGLFGHPNEVPDSLVRDVLARLFPDARTVNLAELDGGTPPGSSRLAKQPLVYQLWADDRQPSIVKFVTHDVVDREVAAYDNHVRERIKGGFHGQLDRHATFWDVGAIGYGLAGATVRRTFATYYRHEADIGRRTLPLAHFFKQVWETNYRRCNQALIDGLVAAYDGLWQVGPALEELAARPETGGDGPDLLRKAAIWVLRHKDDSRLPGARLGVVHGNLHAGNLLVADQHAWPIDFERTSVGPILADFVALEGDLLTRVVVLPAEDHRQWAELIDALLAPESLDAPLDLAADSWLDPEAHRACQLIGRLRVMARDVTGCGDIREYYWGLLLNVLVTGAQASDGSVESRRAAGLSDALCQRLQHWTTRPWRRAPVPSLPKPLPAPGPGVSSGDPAVTFEPSRRPVKVVYSYSHKDEHLLPDFQSHLAVLRRQSIISTWHDRRITPGDRWDTAITEHFATADLVLFLVSADLLASDYCYQVEMVTALSRQATGAVTIVPVILRACEWTATPLGQFKSLPTDGRPVTSWPNRDEAWSNVASGIKAAAESIARRLAT